MKSQVETIQNALNHGLINNLMAEHKANLIVNSVHSGMVGECSSYQEFLRLKTEAEKAKEFIQSLHTDGPAE